MNIIEGFHTDSQIYMLYIRDWNIVTKQRNVLFKAFLIALQIEFYTEQKITHSTIWLFLQNISSFVHKKYMYIRSYIFIPYGVTVKKIEGAPVSQFLYLQILVFHALNFSI